MKILTALFFNFYFAFSQENKPLNQEASFFHLPGWRSFGNGYQYKMTSSKMNYIKASEECNGWGGTLAQNGIRDRFYYRKLADHFESPCWIGLDDRKHERNYRWADKRPIKMGWYQPWNFFGLNNRAHEDCVIMTKPNCNFLRLPMMLDDVHCNRQFYGLCERSVGTKPSYKYTTMDGKMFTLITSETTFSVAKEMCKYWGGKLAEEPASNLRLARKLVKELYNNSALLALSSWVGLDDIEFEGNVRFTSQKNNSIVFVNWGSTVNRYDRDCATFNPRSFGSIQLENCFLKKTILCEKSIKYSEQTQSAKCQSKEQKCKIDSYRSIEGTCHNLLNSDRGREKRAFKRMLPADYDDGFGSPRGGFPSRLPSARAITQGLKGSSEPPSLFASHQLPLWGQFLAHDLTKLGELKDKSGALLLECHCGDTNEECFNIPIPVDDPVYQQMECYSFVRAERVPDVDCETITREQENRVTSYIDASNVYGSNPLFFNNLRRANGLLKIGNYSNYNHYSPSNLPIGDEVPKNLHSQFECEPIHFDFTNTSCFAGGDIRVNEHAALASGHTTWLRKHNQIATELKRLNPHWDGNKIFWTARSIIAAIHQQISFNEFFPILLGQKNMERFGLKLTKQGYYYGFDATYDSTIDISFATAAFRLGHTLINGFLSQLTSNFSSDSNLPPIDLRSRFFDTTPLLHNGGASSVLRGMVTDTAMNYDTSFASALTNHLFARAGEFGRDLPAINIQRGRDHGIPSYLEHRRFCGLSTASRFEELEDIPPQNQEKLKRIYQNTEDIDLFPGGIAELPRDNSSGVPGPTFACIIAYQARDLRRGDRFWFENGGAEAQFTYNQLQSIKHATLSRILCDVGENMITIQPKAMMQHTIEGNERVNCSSLPNLNLEPFRESQNGFEDASQNGDNAEEDLQWSAWFPYSISTSEKVPLKPAPSLLRHLRVYRADDVCVDVLGTEVRKVNGFFQVRYKCPPGAIKATDFPPVDSKEVYWTNWLNKSSPKAPYYDDYEPLNGSGACLYPVAMQAQTVDGSPSKETGDVFEMFAPFQGLMCKGIHQESRRCHDYRVRYLCLKSSW